MQSIDKLELKYLGYKEPETEEEVELEILGLRTAIAAAEQRIAVLEQSLKMREIMRNAKGDIDEKAVEKTADSKET